MGFITSSELARSQYPTFLVEATRVVLKQEASDTANRLGVLKLGDIAVVDEDVLETWPWVVIPAGSRVRDAMDPDIIVDLEQDAWLRVAKRVDEEKDLATRCPEGSAAVHLCICRCQHYRVAYKQVLVREDASETARPVGKFIKGDLLCTGTSSSSSSREAQRDKRWAFFGPDSAVWPSAQGLNNPPKALLSKGILEAAMMKEHPQYGKLLQLVKQRNDDSKGDKGQLLCDKGHCLRWFTTEAGYPCDLCEEEAVTGAVMWGCHKQNAKGASLCNYDICYKCRSDPKRRKASEAARVKEEEGIDAAEPAEGTSPPKQEEEEGPRWSKWLKKHEVDPVSPVNYSPDLPPEDVNEAIVRRILTESGNTEDKSDKDPEASKVWFVVTKSSSGVRIHDDPSSELLLDLEASDVIVSEHGPATPMLTSVANQASTWLCLRNGDMIIRFGQVIATVAEKPVFIQVCVEDGSEHLRPWDVDMKVCIQALSGFGTPWVVMHKSVPVRNEPSTVSLPLGLACRNDIVGVQAGREEWVQLTVSTDSRAKEGGHARPTHDFRTHVNNDLKASLWMLTEHKTIGTLLARLPEDKPCSLSTEGLLLSCVRRGIYHRVTEVCHRRIWKDNLDDLWEGEVEKLPPLETVEAKLFRPNIDVLHARRGGEFRGGAIMESFHIEVCQEQENGSWACGGPLLQKEVKKAKEKEPDWESRRAHVRVGYVHYCATEPGSRVGKPLWEEICRLATARHLLFVACHSILRQGTVDFWRSVGMKRLDPQDSQDRAHFKNQVNVRSQGSLNLEVEDLVQALPKSALPLFIWENVPALEAWCVQADNWAVESEAEDEAKAAIDKKVRRELLKIRHHHKGK